MKRFFLHLAYNGSSFHGWQIQPHSISVQETIENVISTVLNKPTSITGCGRTDTGVHASYYVAHFEHQSELPKAFLRRINRMLPDSISIYKVEQVGNSPNRDNDLLHARFDATYRAYRYDICKRKDPFKPKMIWSYYNFDKIDLKLLKQAASLILEYQEFATFCKSKSDAKTMKCTLFKAEWSFSEESQSLHFYIAGNRFLRGMVRLTVGACIQVAIGEIKLEDLKHALDNQMRLNKPLSVPADGLYLVDIKYN